MNNTRIEQLIQALGNKLLQLFRVKKNILPALEIYTGIKQRIHMHGLKKDASHWDLLLKDMMKLSSTLELLLKDNYTRELRDVVNQICIIINREKRTIKESDSFIPVCVLQKDVSAVVRDSDVKKIFLNPVAISIKDNATKGDDLVGSFTPAATRSSGDQCEDEEVKTKLIQVDTKQKENQVERNTECGKTVECLQSNIEKTSQISCQQEMENTECCKTVKYEETITEKPIQVHIQHNEEYLGKNTNCKKTVEYGKNIADKLLQVHTQQDEKQFEGNTDCDKTLKCPQATNEKTLQTSPQQVSKQDSENCEWEKIEDGENSDIRIKLQVCSEQVDHYEQEINDVSNQKRKPIIVLIGETGAGKSSLGNMLLGKKVFQTSVGSEGCTAEVTAQEGRWQGSGEEVVVVDCPGLGDLQDRDDAYVDCMVNGLKKLGYVTMFLLVVNGEQPRLSQARFDMMDVFRGVFSIKMFTNTLLVFTHWGYDMAAVKRREEQGCTNVSRTRDYNNRLQKRYKFSKPLPASFVDCVLSVEDMSQERTLKELEGIKNLVFKMKPYDCVNIFKMKENIKELSSKLREAQKLKESLFCWANRTQRKEAGIKEEHAEDLQKIISNVADSVSCCTSRGVEFSAVNCMPATDDTDTKETEVKCRVEGSTASFRSNGQPLEKQNPVEGNCGSNEKGKEHSAEAETKSSVCDKSSKQKHVKSGKKGEKCSSKESPETHVKGKQFIRDSIEAQKLWEKIKGSAHSVIKVLNTTATILTQSRSPFLKGEFGLVMQVVAIFTKLILALTLL